MVGDFNETKAQALLGSTQALRMHWSGLITQVMNFAILTNVAVWTFSLQAYIDIFNREQFWAHSYIAAASTISIVLLVLWRWYTHYLDNTMCDLYPDLVFFEGKLSCPPQYGTLAYLKSSLGDIGKLLDTVPNEQRPQVIRELVKDKLMGGRGHTVINSLTLAAVIFLALLIFGLGILGFWKIGFGATEQGIVRLDLKWICGIISIGGIISMIVLLAIWQHKPSEPQLKNIIRRITYTKQTVS